MLRPYNRLRKANPLTVVPSPHGKHDLTIARSSPPLEDYVERFIAEQDVRPNSKALYRRTLRQYFLWVQKKKYSLAEITRKEILEYKQDLLDSGKSPLTVGSYITSCRRFYEWLESHRIAPNISKGVKSPKRQQKFKKKALGIEQSKTLLDHSQGTESLRNFALINLMIRTGLRCIETTRLDCGDITYIGSQRVLMIHGKGHHEKDNFVLLTDKAFAPIERYLQTRKNVKNDDPLFVSDGNNSRGKRLTTRTISLIAKTNLKGMGLNNRCFTAHSLRHSCACNILRAGGEIHKAQETLRHSNISTTMIYLETIKEEQRLQNSGEALLDTLF